MSSMETGLTGADIAQDVMGILSGEPTADTVDETPVAEVESGNEETGETRPDVVEDEAGRLRDPETGRFVAREGETEEEANAAEADPEDEGFVLEVDDEETAEKVASYLEKYGGDITKALVGATEAQSLIGRKGNESAAANAELAAVKQELERLSSTIEANAKRPPMVPITQDLIEQNPAVAAAQAVLQDNVPAFQAAIAYWQEENPEAAKLFLEKVALEHQLAELNKPVPATVVAPQVELDAEVAKVLERHPDLETYLPKIAAAAEENPLLKNAMENGSPADAAQALEALTIIAKSRTGSDTSTAAMRKVQVKVRQEADAARAQARVVTASRGSAATEDPSGKDQFLAAFEARLGISVPE